MNLGRECEEVQSTLNPTQRSELPRRHAYPVVFSRASESWAAGLERIFVRDMLGLVLRTSRINASSTVPAKDEAQWSCGLWCRVLLR